MLIKPISLAILIVLAMTACKKEDAKTDAESTASAPTGLLGQATVEVGAQAKAAKAKAALPQPDAGKPLAIYSERGGIEASTRLRQARSLVFQGIPQHQRRLPPERPVAGN